MEPASTNAVTRRHLRLEFPGPYPALTPLQDRKSFSPERVRESIHLTRAENLWRYIHAETHREPALSHSSSVVFPYPTSNSALSSLTQRANHKLEERQGPEDGSFLHTGSVGMFRTAAGRFPSDSDFKRVIEKLNRLYAQGGVDSLKVALTEGKSHEFLLDADDWMYARVGLYGQLCPVVINISRSRGRLVAYTSKTAQEPVEMYCDSKFVGDRIWVSDAGVRFRTQTLFIGFHALEDATFTLHVQFGQKKRIVKDKWKSMSEGMFGAKDDEWTKLFANFSESKPKLSKNFIMKNRVTVGRESPERISYLTERSSVTDLKRREVLQRWHVNLEQKRQRALDVVHRQELREMEKQRQLDIAREKAAVSSAHRKWLTLIWAANSVDHFLRKFEDRKAELEVEARKATALRKIQRAYRRSLHETDRRRLGLRRGNVALQLCVRSLRDIEWVGVSSSLISCIRISATNARIPIHFRAFYEKSKR